MNKDLQKYVQQTLNVLDRLYEVEDSMSEATFLSCFNNCQRRLREHGYKNLAYNFLIEFSLYHEWRMEHPLKHNYTNVRRGNNLGIEVLLSEDGHKSTRMIRFAPWEYMTGNTIHQQATKEEE